MDSHHRSALDNAVRTAEVDDEITGLLVCGSVARGDALPESDLDLRVLLLGSAGPRPFHAEWQDGVFVERTFLKRDQARKRLDTRPMEVYPYCEGEILYDPNGVLRELCRYAKATYEAYKSPTPEKSEMHYWLESATRKIRAALVMEDFERAAFVSTTTTWPILTGLFLAATVRSPLGGYSYKLARCLPPREPFIP